MTEVKMTRKHLAICGVSLAAIVGMVVGGAWYNQTKKLDAQCTNIEERIVENGDELVWIGEQLEYMNKLAEADPLASFGMLGTALEAAAQAAAVAVDLESNVKEYVEVCPTQRQERFQQSERMRDIGKRLEELEI